MLTLEKLHGSFVLFGFFSSVECAQIPALARRWINLS